MKHGTKNTAYAIQTISYQNENNSQGVRQTHITYRKIHLDEASYR